MTKLKKFTDFMNSLRFRLVLLLILIGVIPCVLLRIGMLNSYENRAVSLRTSEILSQAKILANQIVSNDYLENSGSPTINAQLEQLSTIYDGRVMIISDTFQVVKDTYKLDEKKTIISEEVIKSFYGEEITKYDSKYRYIEMTIPLVRTDQENESRQVIGVMMVSVSTDSISLNLDYLATNTRIIELICIFTVIFASVIIAGQMVRPFHKMSKSIDEIQTGYGEDALSVNDYTETKLISEKFNKMLGRMKVLDDSRQEFVSNVSHELKTPLTSIVNYVDLLKKEDMPSPAAREYIAVLDRQSHRLKKLTEDLVEASKASSGALNVELQPTDVNVLLSQIEGEYQERLAACHLTLVTQPPAPGTMIQADSRLLSRVMDNLVSNVCKYAMENTRVYVTAAVRDGQAVISFKNVSRDELNISPDELMERFVRGDASRHSEGSGLGLSIARSLVQLQGGTFALSIDADLFRADIVFPLI